MEKVRIALYTPLPGFANDLCDVLKLFFQVEAFDVNPEGEGGEPLRHDYQERGGVARSVMHLRGRSFSMEQALPQAAPGGDGEHLAVALKRVRKRLCKLSLYRLLKELTARIPRGRAHGHPAHAAALSGHGGRALHGGGRTVSGIVFRRDARKGGAACPHRAGAAKAARALHGAGGRIYLHPLLPHALRLLLLPRRGGRQGWAHRPVSGGAFRGRCGRARG